MSSWFGRGGEDCTYAPHCSFRLNEVGIALVDVCRLCMCRSSFLCFRCFPLRPAVPSINPLRRFAGSQESSTYLQLPTDEPSIAPSRGRLAPPSAYLGRPISHPLRSSSRRGSETMASILLLFACHTQDTHLLWTHHLPLTRHNFIDSVISPPSAPGRNSGDCEISRLGVTSAFECKITCARCIIDCRSTLTARRRFWNCHQLSIQFARRSE